MGERLGQHFLENPLIAQKMAGELEIDSTDKILEIGPGKGFLTAYLLEAGARVIAVEIDEAMIEKLNGNLSNKKLEIYNRDFIRFNLNSIDYNKVCGNLPYNLTGKIIEKVLREGRKWEAALFMVPFAVAQRAVAQSGSSHYSSFSILCQSSARSEIVFKVGRNNFVPPPEIESAVIKLTRTAPPPSEFFFKVVRAAFSGKRKKVKNNLKNKFNLQNSEVRKILSESGIDSACRPHQIDIAGYSRLTEKFLQHKESEK
jgi:16S rRNA (adenine1518-N6/adenine1519-N6)-dimethyltransferase